jgi:hypothetical protein
MPKRSRLVRKFSGPDFKWHLRTGHKKCPRNDHSNTGRFGIRMVTVQSNKFAQFSNGLKTFLKLAIFVWYSNAIGIPEHLTLGHK